MRRLLIIALLLIYLLIIIYFSLSRIELPNIGVSQIDKVYHAIAYTGLAMLIIFSFKRGVSVPMAFLTATAFGLLMEFFQYFMPFRNASIFDVMANMAGALTGAYGGAWLKGRLCGGNSDRRSFSG